jgi:glycosyltransferase involved in cell wall biosynthesis
MKPVVTIGLCVKNVQDTVEGAVNSVLFQNFPCEKMEIIVVDGQSKDKTVDIIKTLLSKEKIRFHIFYENKGLGAARQIVIKNAAGKYIIWVDGDMVLSKDFVNTQVDFMEKNSAVGVAKGSYGILYQNSLVATLENMEFVVDSSQHAGKVTSNIALGTSGCIYRVKAIRHVGGFDEELKGVGEDMDAEYRVKAAGWTLHISPAVFYEKRRASWKSLWTEYFWHGSGAHFLFQKNRRAINIFIALPPVALLTESKRSLLAYKITHKKVAFLLPFHWIFKRTAWLLGFMYARNLMRTIPST